VQGCMDRFYADPPIVEKIDHKFILWESLFITKAERSRRIEATLSSVPTSERLCNSLN
jgi:hypothetical protein